MLDQPNPGVEIGGTPSPQPSPRGRGGSALDEHSIVRRRVTRVRGGQGFVVDDLVAAEEPLEIRVLGEGSTGSVSRSVSVTMRTPGHDFELAAGFLFTEGILHRPEDVARISYCLGDLLEEQAFNVVNVELAPSTALDEARLTRNFFMSSSCGVCGKATLESIHAQGCNPVGADGAGIDQRTLCALPEQLHRAQDVFRRTGGLHAAGLFRLEGTLVNLQEDVGRHNAVDKVIGERFLGGNVPLSAHVLVVSGRASFEIVQKAAVASIPVVAAVGAPSSLAIETAEEFGITLVGFLRSDGFNVYANPDRIRRPSGPGQGIVPDRHRKGMARD